MNHAIEDELAFHLDSVVAELLDRSRIQPLLLGQKVEGGAQLVENDELCL